MNEVYRQVVTILNSMWRRRWYVLTVGWVVCGVGWTVVAHLPDTYESSARVYVDVDSLLRRLIGPLAPTENVRGKVDIMRRTLLSRPNLEKVILMTDLDLKVRDDKEKETLVDDLKDKIHVGEQGPNLFNVSFSDEDPTLAKRVVQSVLQIFVESNVGASRKDMDQAQVFLNDQVAEYERQLEEAEARVARFKQKNIDTLSDKVSYYGKLQAIQAQLKKDEALLQEATALAEEVRAELKTEHQYLQTDVPDAASNGAEGMGEGPESELEIKILDLTQLIEDLKTQYTDKHPDVVTAKRRLARLQKQLDAQRRAAAEMGDSGQRDQTSESAPAKRKSVVPNPVYEKLKLQLVEKSGDIAAYKLRVRKDKEALESWQKLAEHVPQVEQEMTRLNRDYTILKEKYKELRTRQESARLAHDMETKAQTVQFQIVDPPKVPIVPSGPNRPLLISAVLVVGLGAGLAVAFLLGQISTTFASVARLRDAIRLPVVGSITAAISIRDRRRQARELLSFGVVGICLVIAFGGLMVVDLVGAHGVLQTVSTLL